MTDIAKVLAERGTRYGEFKDHAVIAQGLKKVMKQYPGWERLAADQREALEMVQHKIARILNGDPNYIDSWLDGVGYFQLVVDRLESGIGMSPPLPAQAEPSDDGWIAWGGGECPVEDGTLVDVQYRDGKIATSLPAKKIVAGIERDACYRFWENDNAVNDIIAYRISIAKTASAVA